MNKESFRRIAVAILGVKEKIKIKIKAVDGDGGPLPVDAIAFVHDGYFELQLATAVKSISYHIEDSKLRQSARSAGTLLLEVGLAGMKQAFADDDVPPCGNDMWFWWWLRHHVGPGPGPDPGPEPYFKQLVQAGIFTDLFGSSDPMPGIMEAYGFSAQAICAELLRQVAGLTVNAKASSQLLNAAGSLMKANSAAGASAKFDEECGSTGPRHIIHIPHGVKMKEKSMTGMEA